MRIAVPKEIKDHEYRVGLTPQSVAALVSCGHSVVVESGAGTGVGLTDGDYMAAGAQVAQTASQVFGDAELIVKVKEPQAQECEMMGEGQTLFTYLHLAADPGLTKGLLESGVRAIAYETVTGPGNSLPLLSPMSEVAGRLSVQAGAHCLEKPQGGCGSLIGGASGVPPARVLIVGGGTVGVNAARIACGMGAQTTVLERSQERIQVLEDIFGEKVQCVLSSALALQEHAVESDLIIGAVLLPGAVAPKLLKAEALEEMREGTVLVDVAIDQGGCFETSRPTTHQEPTYSVGGIVHYCVTNMPGVVPRTATFALNEATLPYVLALANQGVDKALQDEQFRAGLNVDKGRLRHPAVAEAYEQTDVS